MRFPLFIFLCFASPLHFLSQNSPFNNALKFKLDERSQPGEILTVLVEGNLPALAAQQHSYNYTLNYSSGPVASLSCRLPVLALLVQEGLVTRAEFMPPHVRPMNDTMIYRNRIKPVKVWTAPLPRAYNGEGVVLGFIDTGLDFSHPDFKDSLGKTRIRFLWDQAAVSSSQAPAPFNYGTEWTSAQINASLCTHNDLPHYGHGTHVAGIAAGNGLANGRHQGCASKAEIVAVAIDFNKAGPTIPDAVQYIFAKAAQLGKPCVINASLGDYYGSHDGTDLESKLIESQVKASTGHVLVAAAGNAGNIKYHVKTQPPVGDTAFTWLQNGASKLYYWCYGDTAQVKNLQFSIGANRANYSSLGRTAFRSSGYALGSIKRDTLKHNGQRIGIVKSSASINNYGVYELFMEISADSTGLLWRVESKGAGLHHAWNFDFVSGGLPQPSQYPGISKYAMPDSLYTMVSGFQCSDEIITVANYVNLNSYYDVTDTLRHTSEITGQLAPASSRGPTRDGRQKPDIAASGNGIFSAMALGMQANLISTYPSAVAQGSMHVTGGGTSASSPVVAGLAALYLQRYPNATNIQVRDAIRNCAYFDNFTGSNLPNSSWGFGKLDGKATMYCGEVLFNGIAEQQLNNTRCYPNPFTGKTLLSFGKAMQGKIYLYAADGKLLFEDKIQGTSYELVAVEAGLISPGLFFARVITEQEIYSFKLIYAN